MRVATSSRIGTRALLFPTFVLIAALFGCIHVIGMSRGSAIRGETQSLVHNMLASVAQVSRMNRDIDQERLLVDAHLFEHDPRAPEAEFVGVLERLRKELS